MTALAGRIDSLLQIQATARAGLTAMQDALDSLRATLHSQYNELSSFADLVGREAQVRQDYEGYDNLKRDIARTLQQKQELSVVFENATAQSVLEQKALKLYADVLDSLTEQHVLTLQSTLSEVYTYVFQNPNKRISLELVDRYKKKVLQLSILNDSEGTTYTETLDDSGFSVETVLGTMLLVYYILYNNLERVIFFDESFTGLSDETAGRFFSMLRVFVEQYGFKFLLISHDTRYVEYADASYFVRGGRYLKEGKE
jgi:hypothetical protein